MTKTIYWLTRAISTKTASPENAGYKIWPGNAALHVNVNGEAMYWHDDGTVTPNRYCEQGVWDMVHPELTLRPGQARQIVCEHEPGVYETWYCADEYVRTE